MLAVRTMHIEDSTRKQGMRVNFVKPCQDGDDWIEVGIKQGEDVCLDSLPIQEAYNFRCWEHNH